MVILHMVDFDLALRVWKHALGLLNLVALLGDLFSLIVCVVEVLVVALYIVVLITFEILVDISCFVGRLVSIVETIDWAMTCSLTAQEVLRVTLDHLIFRFHVNISEHLLQVLGLRVIKSLSIIQTLLWD